MVHIPIFHQTKLTHPPGNRSRPQPIRTIKSFSNLHTHTTPRAPSMIDEWANVRSWDLSWCPNRSYFQPCRKPKSFVLLLDEKKVSTHFRKTRPSSSLMAAVTNKSLIFEQQPPFVAWGSSYNEWGRVFQHFDKIIKSKGSLLRVRSSEWVRKLAWNHMGIISVDGYWCDVWYSVGGLIMSVAKQHEWIIHYSGWWDYESKYVHN